MLHHGADAVDLSSDVYDISYVPSPEEHFLHQGPSEMERSFRPRLMLSKANEEFSVRVLEQLLWQAVPSSATILASTVTLFSMLQLFI